MHRDLKPENILVFKNYNVLFLSFRFLLVRRSERRHGGQAHGLRVVVCCGDDGASDHEVRHSELHGSRAGREVGVHNEGGDVGMYAW